MLFLGQSFSGFGPKDPIRYDEFKRFVREDRVDWVHLTPDEIRGEYREGQKPAVTKEAKGGKKEASAERPDRFVTGRLQDDTLIPLLEEKKVAFRAMRDGGLMSNWPWLMYLLLSFGLMMLLWNGLSRRMGGGGPMGGGVLAFGKNKGKVFQEDEVSVSFDDVEGVEEAKEELQEIIEFLKTPDKYMAIGAKIPKGVLLVGPPGTGKTLLARAVAGEAEVPFISINGSEFVEMFVGVGAARVRDLFEQAGKSAPCIVFIDELDAIGRSRGGGAMGPGSNEEREQTLNQLLVEMDGFESNTGVILMSATNRPEILDPALMRPGRFDRQVVVDRPNKEGRLGILRVHVRGVKLDDDVDLGSIASRTPGFAGADLANLVNEAALLAARRGKEQVSTQEFSDAVDRVVAGLAKKSRLINEEERKRVAYHEVGHALAGVLSGSDERVHKISIIPRGFGALGFTMQMPEEDRQLLTESALKSRLVGLMGGRCAEVVVFGEPSTGAQNDLQKATELARSMVTEFGMSVRIGPMALRREARPMFLAGNGSMGAGVDAGHQLANLVDDEIRDLVSWSEREATRLLEGHRGALEYISKRLIELEQLEGDELDDLLRKAKARELE